MELKRLFHVLVVVGGSLGAGCDGATRTGPLTGGAGGAEAPADAEAAGDGAVDGTTPGGEAGTETGAASSLCFCSPTRCCDQHEGAPATVQAGFECCWGSSC
jgi:hypothetical protein